MGCILGTGCHLPVLTPLPAGMIAFSTWIDHCIPFSIRQGGLHVKELFPRIRRVSSRITAAFLQKSTSVDIREKTRETLDGCPCRAGQRPDLGLTGSAQRRFSSVWMG